MHTKRNLFGALFTVFFVWGGVVCLTARDDGQERIVPSSTKTSTPEGKTVVASQIKPMETPKEKRALFRSSQRKRLLMTRQETQRPLTDEEMIRFAAMTAAVRAQFFEQAPFAFDDILDHEEYDGRWTASRKKALEEILSDQAFAAMRLVDIRCYELACKIELSGGNEEDLLHLQNALTKNDILFGAAHFFQRRNTDGTFETDAYIGRPGEDQQINYAVTARLYQNVTGKSPDSIVPTQAQLDRMFAYREAHAR